MLPITGSHPSGYLAGIISGYFFGLILDRGGYLLGFHCLAVTTVVGAVLCLGLNRPRQYSLNGGSVT